MQHPFLKIKTPVLRPLSLPEPFHHRLHRKLHRMHGLPGCRQDLYLLSHLQPPRQRDSRARLATGVKMSFFYEGIHLFGATINS